MNNKGEVDGIASLPDDNETHAFLWRNGIYDLGTLGGAEQQWGRRANSDPREGRRRGYSPNLYSKSVGEKDFASVPTLICFPVPLEKWSYDPLPTLGGSTGVGRHQQPAKSSGWRNTTPEPDCSLFCKPSCAWEHGKFKNFLRSPARRADRPSPQTNLGQVTGLSGGWPGRSYSRFALLVLANGALTDLGNLGGTESAPSDINNRGQVVGASFLPGDTTSHAFLWTKSNGMRMSHAAGDFSATAGAFLLPERRMTDLNTLVPGAALRCFCSRHLISTLGDSLSPPGST